MKKIISMLCVLLTLLTAFPLTSFAAESKTTTLDYTVESSYTVTLPEYIEANADGQEVKIADAVIPFGYEVDVTAEFDNQLKLREANGITIPYTFYADDEEVTSGDSVLKQIAGANDDSVTTLTAKTSSDANYSGVYTATVTFNVDVKEITQTDYTVEEIDENPLLFGIGATKPEYVVAQFTEDYSAVLVTKNGDDSDGRMKGWNARESEFSLNKETLNTALIKEGVINIGVCAFYGCENLITVDFPESLTIIADNAFNRCHALNNIDFPDSVKSIGSSAFYECYALIEVILPESLTTVSNSCFSRCKGLVNLFVGENVKSIGSSAFSECDLLANVSLPNGLQSIGLWAFRYAYALEGIIIPETVTTMADRAFSECKALKSINIPKGITKLSYGLLYSCTSLESIEIPFGVTTIEKYALQYCSKIKTLEIPDTVTTIEGNALADMRSVEYFSVSENNENFCIIDGALYSKDATKLYFYPQGKNIKVFTVPSHVTTLGTGCFGIHKYLKDIYVPETVITVEEYTITNAGHPALHTPIGSAFEQYCIESTHSYDNEMI